MYLFKFHMWFSDNALFGNSCFIKWAAVVIHFFDIVQMVSDSYAIQLKLAHGWTYYQHNNNFQIFFILRFNAKAIFLLKEEVN